MENNQSVLEKFEIVKFGPCKFVGYAAYLGNKRGTKSAFYDFMWKQNDWVFEALDGMKEYAAGETQNFALIAWDKHYDEKSELFGYYIGRFMKADTPITKDLDFDYFDIPEIYVAKARMKVKADKRFGIFAFDDKLMNNAINNTGLYKEAGWIFSAETYPVSDGNGNALVDAYMSCLLKNADN
ncbi:MAG: hypothetical protein LBI03_04135 [Clostridiales bacterium]|jgi:hypothetical protein|nr:hypothetical protein [Clostridiales bacterium]